MALKGTLIATISSIVKARRLKPQRLQHPKATPVANAALGQVKTAIKTFVAARKPFAASIRTSDQLVGTWNDVKTLEKQLASGAYRTPKQRLTDAVLNDISADLKNTLVPCPRVLQHLDRIAQKEVLARQMRFTASRAALKATISAERLGLTRNLGAIFADAPAQVAVWQSQFERDLDTLLNGVEQSKPAWVTAATLPGQVADAYTGHLRAYESRFEQTHARTLTNAIYRDRHEPKKIVEILDKNRRIDRDTLSPVFLSTRAHQIDQLDNGVATIADRNGGVWLQRRPFQDGGPFAFEQNWLSVSSKLAKQVTEAGDGANVPVPMTRPVVDMHFVDQIALTPVAQAGLDPVGQTDLKGSETAIKRAFVGLVGAIRGVTPSQTGFSIDEHEGISNGVGLENLITWLNGSMGRCVSVHIDANGVVYIAMTLNIQVAGLGPVPRSEINDARLMALLVVALLDRAVNGLGLSRSYPKIMTSDEQQLEIPPHCVWPLQVDLGAGAVSSGRRMAGIVAEQGCNCAKTKDWMLGWEDVPKGAGGVSDMLAERFNIRTQKLLQTLQTPRTELASERKGLNSADALQRITNTFMWSSLILGLLWFCVVLLSISSLFQPTRFELWIISLLFFGFAFWRFLLISLVIVSARHVDRKDVRKPGWVRLRLKIVNTAFAAPWVPWIAPALLGLIAVLCLFDQWGGPNVADPAQGAASFKGALTDAVWALPVVGIGLLRQAYVMLLQLVVERGQLRSRMQVLNDVEDNWKAGTTFADKPSGGQYDTLAKLIATSRARLQTELAAAERQFGEKSATNATLVALVSLLQPISGMSPSEAFNADLEAEFILNRVGTEPGAIYAEAAADPSVATDATVVSGDAAGDCGHINDDLLRKKAEPGRAFVHQTMLTASLIDCIGLSNGRQAEATMALRDDVAQIGLSLQEIAELLRETGSGDVQTTYVCVFPFNRHCVQGTDVAVSAADFGTVRADMQNFKDDLEAAAALLDDLKLNRTVTLRANAQPLYDAVGAANDVLSFSMHPRSVRVDAQTKKATAKLHALIALEKDLPTGHDIAITADVVDAVEKLKALTDALHALPDEEKVKLTVDAKAALETIDRVKARLGVLVASGRVPLRADVEQLYRDLGLAKRLIEAFPERRDVYLGGLIRRPLLDVDLWVQPGGDQGGAEGGAPDPLLGCELVATRLFGVNKPSFGDETTIWSGKWQVNGQATDTAETTLGEVLARDHQGKLLYVLGLADGQGDPLHNLALSQLRADAVAKALRGSVPGFDAVALNLGEAGWLTRHGLSGGEDDPAHRAAQVLACPNLADR
ncbi:MAG: hypothetical protein AAFV31_14785 [Pseudomonadota bacterium]